MRLPKKGGRNGYGTEQQQADFSEQKQDQGSEQESYRAEQPELNEKRTQPCVRFLWYNDENTTDNPDGRV